MGSSPKAPAPPDPYKTADAQWGFTKNALNYSANLNSPNLYTPFGQVTYQKDANGVPTSQTVSLDPMQQQILDQQRNVGLGLSNAAMSQLQNLPGNQFRISDIGRPLPGVNDYGDWGNKVAQTYYNQAADLIRPDIEQGRGRLEQTLSDRGLPISGEAYQTATGNYERGVGNQLGSIANQAILASGNEMSRLNALENQNFGTALGAALTERQMPFNELAMYLQGSPQQPYQAQQPTVPLNASAPDFAGLQQANYQAQLANYQQKLQNQAGLWGALGDIGGSAFKTIPYW